MSRLAKVRSLASSHVPDLSVGIHNAEGLSVTENATPVGWTGGCRSFTGGCSSFTGDRCSFTGTGYRMLVVRFDDPGVRQTKAALRRYGQPIGLALCLGEPGALDARVPVSSTLCVRRYCNNDTD